MSFFSSTSHAFSLTFYNVRFNSMYSDNNTPCRASPRFATCHYMTLRHWENSMRISLNNFQFSSFIAQGREAPSEHTEFGIEAVDQLVEGADASNDVFSQGHGSHRRLHR